MAPKTLAKALLDTPALRGLVEKYGPPDRWPEVLKTLTANTTRPPSCRVCSPHPGEPATGWVNRPYPNPDRSQPLPCWRAAPCPECHGGDAELREALWQKSGISGWMREGSSFAGFDLAANPDMQGALDAARRWGAGDGHPFLLLRSAERGLGKTHLAVAAAAACIERLEEVAYFVVPDLLGQMRATQRPGAEETLDGILYRTQRVSALILDDLGANRATEFADEQLFTVLNARYERGLRTFVTTNERLEDLEPRIRSRLLDTRLSCVLACKGSDYRLRRQG